MRSTFAAGMLSPKHSNTLNGQSKSVLNSPIGSKAKMQAKFGDVNIKNDLIA